jgi:flavin-binding protein dodecin
VADNVYSVSEIVGTSANSIDDAIRGAVEHASKTLPPLDWFEVTEIRGHVEGGTLGHYQVAMKVGFRAADSA